MLDRDLYRGLNNEMRERNPGPRQTDAFDSLSDEIPLHPEQLPYEPMSSGVAREYLTPVEAAPMKAIDDFAHRLTTIDEEDYGDWMRIANNYWLDLRLALRGSGREIDKYLFDLQMIIQFQPNFKIAETSRQSIAVLSRIRKILGAQDQLNWEEVALGLTQRI